MKNLLGSFLLFEMITLRLTNGFLQLVPQNTQLVYKFTSSISSGTNTPTPYGSQFYFNGNLHLEANSDSSLIAKFSNLSYKIYNGEVYYGHDEKLKDIHISEQDTIYKEFEIFYYSNGRLKGVSKLNKFDSPLDNIRIAIASILQLDIENIDTTGNNTFVTNEDSIYGKNTSVDYNILLGYDDKLMIKKFIYVEMNESFLEKLYVNAEFDYCDVPFEKPISQDSTFNYTIAKLQTGNNQRVVEKIESLGKISTYPLQGKMFTHHITTKQIFQLIDIVSTVRNLKTDQNKEIVLSPKLNFKFLSGVTEDYQKSSFQEKRSQINTILQRIMKNQDTSKEPGKQGQLVNEIINLLSTLNYNTLEKIYYKTEDTYLKVFYELLPLVGSRSSVQLIKKLIYKKLVEDDVASTMLKSFPFYVRDKNEKILRDIEDFLNLDNQVSREIHKQAVLCFSVMLYKSFQHQLSFHHHPDNYTDQIDDDFRYYKYVTVPDKLISFFNKHKIYLKYVDEIGQKIMSTDDFELKILYCSALFNTRIYKAADYLVPIVMDKNNYNYKLQTFAATALSSIVYKDNEKLYFPIFTDISRPIELRTVAYYFIMESRPDFPLLLKVHNHIKIESNQELYHYHYNYLKTLSKSTEVCHRQIRSDAETLLKSMPKPNNQQSLSGYYQSDYRDAKYGFGSGVHYALFDMGTWMMFQADWNSQIHNLNRYLSALFVRIYGFEVESFKNLYNFNVTLESLWEIFSKVSNKENLHVDVQIGYYDLIVESNYYDSRNLSKLFNILECVTSKTSMQIYYDISAQLYLPTDLGFPVSVEMLTPVIYQKEQSSTAERINKIINFQMDNKYQLSRYTYYGLSFYSPFIDSWQGISRYNWNSLVVPLYADVHINFKENYVKLSLKKHKEKKKNLIGFESHVITETFVKGGVNSIDTLLESCPYCESSVSIIKEKEIQKERIIQKIPGLGYEYDALIYDGQGQIHFKWPNELLTIFANDVIKSYQSPVGFAAILEDYWFSYSLLLPESARSGFLVNAFPTNQIDITMQIKKEVSTSQGNTFKPNFKFYVYGNYLLLHNDKIVNYWNVTAKTDLKAEHKVKITNTDDLKVCIDSIKNWNSKGINVRPTINLVCNENNGNKGNIITIDITGKRSDLPSDSHNSYDFCQPYELKSNYLPGYCPAVPNSVGKYSYDIRTRNMPKEYRNILSLWIDCFKELYTSFYSSLYNAEDLSTDNNIIVHMEHLP